LTLAARLYFRGHRFERGLYYLPLKIKDARRCGSHAPNINGRADRPTSSFLILDAITFERRQKQMWVKLAEDLRRRWLSKLFGFEQGSTL